MKNKLYTVLTAVFCILLLNLSLAQDPTPLCEDFPPLCDLLDIDGYMGRNPPPSGANQGPFCGPLTTIDNPGFVNFIASGLSVSIMLTWDNCNGDGIQWAIYEDCNGVFADPVNGTCGGDCNSQGGGNTTIAFNTVPGTIYSLMIDGCAGAQCDFTINVTQTDPPFVVEFPLGETISGPIEVCEGATDVSCLTYSIGAVVRATGYLWTLDGVEIETTDEPLLTYSDVMAPGGELCVQGVNQCDSNIVRCIDIIVTPLPEELHYECVCWNDFPVEIEGMTFNGPVINSVISLEGDCGCPYDYVVTIDRFDEPSPTRVIDAVCPEDIGGAGYVFPGQSVDDPPFFGDEIREITITDAIDFTCVGQPTLMCDDVYEVDLRVMNVIGGTLSLEIPCDETMITLDTSHLEFLPLGDPDLVVELSWIAPDGSPIATTDGTIDVTEAGIYILNISLTHNSDEYYSACEFSFDVIVTIPNCACVTQPGSMNLTRIDLCEGSNVSSSTLTLPTLDTGHEIEYILHSNASDVIGTEYGRSDDGNFAFMASYPLDQILYISVVGGPVAGGQVDINGICFAATPGQPVIWHSFPAVNAGPDAEECELTHTFGASINIGSGLWQSVLPQPSVSTFDDASSATATVSVLMPGVYQYEWIGDNNGCERRDTVEVRFRATDAGEIVDQVAALCENDILTVAFIVGEEADLDAGDVQQFEVLNAAGMVIFISTSNMISFDPGSMNLDEQYTVRSSAGRDASGEVNLADPCLDLSDDVVLVTWGSNPVVNAGPDDDACNFTYQFNATMNIGDGEWSLIDGPSSGAIYDLPFSPMATVTVDQIGTYQFIWEGNNGGCVSVDTVNITFRDSPTFGLPAQIICNSDNTSYTVTINITGGDLSSYDVVDPNGVNTGTITGSTFVSDPIDISDLNYVFEVSDQFGCATDRVEDIADCSCQTDAGEVLAETVELCQDVNYEVTFVAGEDPATDANDILLYELYDGSGALIQSFSNGSIAFDPAFMIVGATYTVSTAAGNELTGQLDLTDLCLDRSTNFASVRWSSIPALISSSAEPVCAGDSVMITYGINGDGPFNLFITDQTSNYNIDNYTSNDIIKIEVNGAVTLSLTEIEMSNAPGCVISLNDQLLIDPELTPVLNLKDSIDVCNKALPGRTTSVDFDAWILTGNTGGTWVDLDLSGASGAFPELDFTDIIPGFYRFVYTTNEALNVCNNVSDTLILEVSTDCPCPVIPIMTLPELCNNELELMLTPFAQNAPGPGDWSVISTPTGNSPMTIVGEQLNINGADPGDYVIEFKLRNWPDLCPDSSRQTVTLYSVPQSGVPNGDIMVCEKDDLMVNAFDFLDDEDTGGSWSVGSVSVDIDPVSGSITTRDIPAGTYNLVYTAGPNGACSARQSMVQLDVIPNPVADAGADVVFTCSDTLFVIGGGNTTIGADLVYQWFADDMLLDQETEAELEISAAGSYRLEVMNRLTNCFAEDIIIATVDPNAISGINSDVRDENCDGVGSGSFRVISVMGGQEPYTYQLNDNPPTNQPIFDALPAGDYSLEIFDAFGCPFGFDFVIEAGSELLIDSIADRSIRDGDSIRIDLQVNRNLEDISLVQWGQNVALSCDTCLQVVISPQATGYFNVRVIDNNGCEDEVSFLVIVNKDNTVYIPNVMRTGLGATQESNIFRIYGSDKLQAVNKLIIADRWGNVVYNKSNFDPRAEFWDGTRSVNGSSSGNLLPPAVYVYYVQVQFEDGTTLDFNGDITILR